LARLKFSIEIVEYTIIFNSNLFKVVKLSLYIFSCVISPSSVTAIYMRPIGLNSKYSIANKNVKI
jgi:hypothetical protein